MTEITTNKNKPEIPNPKGPIRFEAIIPVFVLSLLTYFYFSLYFDQHMKKAIEYVATQGNGAEVNVDSVRTSFLRGSFNLDRLQITDPEQPTHNSLEISNIHFSFVWDALLRMKFVVQDASINNLMLGSKRKKPGLVLPPRPASPSKLEEIQNEVMAQVKNKYGANILGDLVTILEGGDYKEQLEKIRETLKSEARVKDMIEDVTTKKEFWDKKVKELSDTSKLKQIETTIASVREEKNFLNQVKSAQKLGDLLKDVQNQYKEIEKSSKELQTEVKAVTNYPRELQILIQEDVASLKNRFSVPEIDFKDMAMHLFAGQFAEYVAKARKYQAIADQYLPEKKQEEDIVIPPKRAEGKNYQFPITTGYPLFWLKRAAISSKGTAESYSGQVSGELTNVTTSPKIVNKPIVLDLRGDFPAIHVKGVKAILTADFTKDTSTQSALIQVNSFLVPEKLFVSNDNLKFGFSNAVGATTIKASIQEKQISMDWLSVLTKPKFMVETNNKLAKEILSNIVNNIPVINIDGTARGSFKSLTFDIKSNLGDELKNGFSREIGAKVTQAQDRIKAMVDEKINIPKSQLINALGNNELNIKNLSNLQNLYRQNEDKIKAEIENLKKGRGLNDLKNKGKEIFKKIKF